MKRRSLFAAAVAALSSMTLGRRASAQMAPAPTILNLGINVTDLEKSKRFYIEALGFQDAGVVVSDPPNCARVFFGRNGEEFLKARDFKAYGKMHHVRMGSLQLLLRQFTDPKPVGSTEAPPTHQLGLSNISVRVDSIERVNALIRKLGGTVFENTWVKKGTVKGNGGAGIIFTQDPDGTQVELVEI